MMRPAFSSSQFAAAFTLLVLAVLLLPAVFSKERLPLREESYAKMTWASGGFPFIYQQIYKEKEDLDIVFIGSSRMYFDIDTPYVQKKLSEKLGRNARVVTLGWFNAGFDATYFIARDLLLHRKVKVLVAYDECHRGDTPHPFSPSWFRWREDAAIISGLPLYSRAGLYAAATMGGPANLLNLLHTNLPLVTLPTEKGLTFGDSAPNPATVLGTLMSRRGADFSDYYPQTEARPADAIIYSSSSKPQVKFTGPAHFPYQLHFARLLSVLAKAQGTKLVILHLPEFSEGKSDVIEESMFWPDTLPAPVCLLGIPPAKLFAGLAEPEINRLFSDSDHLNQNGQRYFTHLITPALFQIYESPARSF